MEKLASHVIFDEAHYGNNNKPPGALLLYNMPLYSHVPHKTIDKTCDKYPPLPQKRLLTPPQALTTFLPLGEFTSELHAASATVKRNWSDADIATIELSSMRYNTAFDIEVPMSSHDTLGLICRQDDMELPALTGCAKHTPAYPIHFWRSKLQFKHIYAIDGVPITTTQHLKNLIKQKRTQNVPSCVITFVSDEILATGIQTEGIPQLYFDQVTLIHKYIDQIHPSQPVVSKLNRRKLEKQDNFQEWLC